MKISSLVQALAIVTLVVVTGYYAKKTRELAEQARASLEEEKKKRRADLGEKMIKEFYTDFDECMGRFKELIKEGFTSAESINRISVEINNILKFYLRKGHLTRDEADKPIYQMIAFLIDFKKAHKEGRLTDWIKEFHEKYQKVGDAIFEDIRFIRKIIFEAYGFEPEKKLQAKQ